MQWIDEADAVFRGGGVKGLALAGALVGFAEHPTRAVHTWKSVAGASAGAIIACYLATGHGPDEMLELMQNTSFGQFADFPGGNKELGSARLLAGRGMAPGQAFERWFDEVLGGATFAAVRKPDGVDPLDPWWLKLIAVDVTAGRLLVLPLDLELYRDPSTGRPIDPDDFPIARAARMSMSIPYFFDPVEHVDTQGRIRPPSFVTKVTPWHLRFAFDIFHTAESAWDERFVSHSTRVRTLAVDADDVGTTDFNLSKEKQELLVHNGRVAAKAFLDDFSLEQYENTYHAGLAQNATAVAS
jgi:NTE family protein